MEQPHGSGLEQNEVLAPACAEMEDEDKLVDLTLVNRQADEADDLEVTKKTIISIISKISKFWKTFVFTLLWCFGQQNVMNNKGQNFELKLKLSSVKSF